MTCQFVRIFAAALLQGLSYTSKTVLVSRGHRTLAVAADISAMLTSSLYLILTASVTLRAGLSFATLEALADIAVGGPCGTIGGMFAVECVERHLTLNTPLSSRLGNRRQDYQRWLSTWLSCRQIAIGAARNGYDDLSPSATGFEIADGVGCFSERINPVDDRRDVAGPNQCL
jgi:hypothetical protein